MSFICEISGESIATLPAHVTIVITPSGHICCKHLLEQLLKDNHNVDPFDSTENRPLYIEDTIVVKQRQQRESTTTTVSEQTQGAAVVPIIPPRTNASANSVTQLVQQIQNEYDSVVLELYTTKQLLQQTRQELSMSLYQNDAAVRVLSRLSQERDAALQQLQHWNFNSAAVSNSSNGKNGGIASKTTHDSDHVNESELNTVTKKQKITDSETTPLINRLPDQDHTLMLQTWEQLHELRKSRQKIALAKANTIVFPNTTSSSSNEDTMHYQIASSAITILTNQQNIPSTILKPYSSTSSTDTIVQCCNLSNEYVLYESSITGTSETDNVKSTKQTISLPDNNDASSSMTKKQVGVRCLDTIVLASDVPTNKSSTTFIVMVLESNENEVVLYKDNHLVYRTSNDSTAKTTNYEYVTVQFHHGQQHIILLSADGVIHICRYIAITDMEYSLLYITQFTSPPSTTTKCNNSALHPDGLIYITALTENGNLLLWDFKSQQVAGTLSYPNSSNNSEQQQWIVSSIEFSNNGYHIAVSYKDTEVIHVWDLRKQSILQILNDTKSSDENDDKNSILEQVMSVKFDDSGKYLAYSGTLKKSKDCAIVITTVKKWDILATYIIPDIKCCYGLLWNSNHSIAVSAISNTTPNSNDDTTNSVELQVVYLTLQS